MLTSRFRGLAGGLAAAVLAGFASPAFAAEASGNQCYRAAALAAKPGENMPRKGIHTFDQPDTSHPLADAMPVPGSLRGAIRSVKLAGSEKLIALTFDLCEQPGEIAGYDGAIFDYLRKEGIKATLFSGGKWMRSHAERSRQLMTDPLFEIANHSEAHRNLRLLSGAALKDEILGPQRAFEAIREGVMASQCVAAAPGAASHIPQRISLFRFPFGACNQASLDAVNGAGLLAIQWSLSVGDPSPAQSAAAIAETMVARTKPGAIIIAHANGRGYHTAEALPLAIPKLIAKGFRFVTVSELLAAGTPVITPTCYNEKPGDTDKYDTFLSHAAPKPEKQNAVPSPVQR